jgi:hypothetical protein
MGTIFSRRRFLSSLLVVAAAPAIAPPRRAYSFLWGLGAPQIKTPPGVVYADTDGVFIAGPTIEAFSLHLEALRKFNREMRAQIEKESGRIFTVCTFIP